MITLHSDIPRNFTISTHITMSTYLFTKQLKSKAISLLRKRAKELSLDCPVFYINKWTVYNSVRSI